MKLSIHRLAFLKKLADVQRAIPSRTTIPILTGVKLLATSDSLVITGSDSDVSIEMTILVEDEDTQLVVHEPGSIVLPAKFFSEIIKKLPSDVFTLTIDSNKKATITAGNASFTLIGIDAAEYPHLPELEVEQVVELPVPIFRQIIQNTSIAISTMESRPLLTGIHILIKDGLLKAVATDSHRLSQRIIPLPASAGGQNVTYDFTIPGKTLVELSRIVEGLETISMSITDNQVLFHTDRLSFYSRLLDGRYPDTDRLITNDSNTTLTMVASELLSAIERASLMSHVGNNNIVKLSLKASEAQLTGHSPEIGTVKEELVYQAITGEDLEISFNPDYMKDALRQFGQAEISIHFLSPVRPFTLRPTESALDIDFNFIQLITPVRTF